MGATKMRYLHQGFCSTSANAPVLIRCPLVAGISCD